MGLFDLGNSKEKQLNSLADEMQLEYDNYEKEAKEINKRIDLIIRDFNDQIPIINTIRNNEFGPQIDKLYKFLKNFGDIGTEISPFDFVTEKSRVNHHNDLSQSLNSRENESERIEGVSTDSSGTAIIGMAAIPILVAGPVILAPFAIGEIIKGFAKNNDTKDKILELRKQIEHSKVKFKKDIMDRESYRKTMEVAISIAEIYRVNIKSISRAIDETILPELGLVKSFLFAEDVKNKIIAKEVITEVRPESIVMYKDTPYNKHYLFVNNTFHFYKMIVEFFSKSILTSLLEDHFISEQEQNDFNNKIEHINNQLNYLQENSIISEVV
jgi:hypothetical protein